MSCCEQTGHNCREGRACPMRELEEDTPLYTPEPIPWFLWALIVLAAFLCWAVSSGMFDPLMLPRK